METTRKKPQLTTFVLWAPDCADENGLARRLAVRESHLERVGRLVQDGIIRVGGAFLNPESINAAPANRKIIGSSMIFEAESMEAARDIVENDIYYTAGVWDKEKLQLFPIAVATPLPSVSS